MGTVSRDRQSSRVDRRPPSGLAGFDWRSKGSRQPLFRLLLLLALLLLLPLLPLQLLLLRLLDALSRPRRCLRAAGLSVMTWNSREEWEGVILATRKETNPFRMRRMMMHQRAMVLWHGYAPATARPMSREN